MNSNSLQSLNLSGNGLADQGLRILLRGIENHPSLTDLRVSFNEITPLGAASNPNNTSLTILDLIEILEHTKLVYLDISKNIIEDESLIMLGDLYRSGTKIPLEEVNLSSCRVTDVGLLHMMESIEHVNHLK